MLCIYLLCAFIGVNKFVILIVVGLFCARESWSLLKI
jgi:hypothetical protein